MTLRLKRFHITAEHTQGASVGHPCKTGTYEDPVTMLDVTIAASTEERAVKAGESELARLVDNARHCECQRHTMPGSDAWWNSVVISAQLLPDE